MNVTILQPSYIPWRGYFHQILKTDVFVFYDDVQYDKHGWRNRNRIKTATGVKWITIPVVTTGVVENNVPINQIKIDWNRKWDQKHWKMIQQSYGKTPYFHVYEDLLSDFYNQHTTHLADFTINSTIAISKALGINHVEFIRASSLENISGTKTDRLINILSKLGATHYISGPSAKEYIEESKFTQAGITFEYMAYDYPEYPQIHPPYELNVSILDLLFMTGNNALKYFQKQ